LPAMVEVLHVQECSITATERDESSALLGRPCNFSF
jgi:hypothetical protein